MAKRISSSGGSSPVPRTTLITDPRPEGVSVMKYDPFEEEPMVRSVTPLFLDTCTRDRRLSRQRAMSDAGRADDAYTIGSAEALDSGPRDEPHAARMARGARRISRFMVVSSASACCLKRERKAIRRSHLRRNVCLSNALSTNANSTLASITDASRICMCIVLEINSMQIVARSRLEGIPICEADRRAVRVAVIHDRPVRQRRARQCAQRVGCKIFV